MDHVMEQTFAGIKFIFEQAPFGVCALDAMGRVIYANVNFIASICGPDEDDSSLMDRHIQDVIPELLLDEMLNAYLDELLQHGTSFSYVVETLSSPTISASGFVNMSGYRLDGAHVIVTDYIGGGFARDTRYKKLIQEAPDAIIIVKNGIVIYANPALGAMLQLPLHEIRGHHIGEFIKTKTLDDMLTLRQEIPSRVQVETPMGTRVLEGRFQTLEDRPGYAIAILRDVTDKVSLEKLLMRQNQDLTVINLISETLSSSIDLGEILENTLAKVLQVINVETGWIFLLNEETRILKCAYSYGLPEYVVQSLKELKVGEGIAGRVAINWEPIIIENASIDPRITSLAFKQQGIKSFASIPLKSRTRLIGVMNIGSFGQRKISANDKRLLLNIGLHMGTVIENVLLFQEVAQATEELQDALSLIGQRNEELKSFVYTVSHDLKNPIVAINGLARRLFDSAGDKLTDHEREYLAAIRDSGRHMEQFLQNLLMLAAVENLKVVKEYFSVVEIIDDVIREVTPQLNDKGGCIAIVDKLPWVKADRTRIMQVFANLVSNGIKYAHPNRAPHLDIGYLPRNDRHVFYVRDNGIGIDPEHQEQIFEVFFRADEEHAEGTGIGLFITKKAVNIMGGDIWVESRKDEGTVFYFSIPTE